MIKRWKVFLVDDHQIVRDGIRSIIEDEPDIYIVDEASNGEEMMLKLDTAMPDIILLDISLPEKSGLEYITDIKVRHWYMRILILSMYVNNDYIFNAIRAGAHGYLPKDTSKDELLTAIRHICEGGEYFGKKIQNAIIKSFLLMARQQENNKEKPILTLRELEILKLFAEGYSNKEIANKLFISVRTVESHKNHIMQKFGFKNTVEMLKYAIKNKIIEL